MGPKCRHWESHPGYRRHKPRYCSYTIAAERVEVPGIDPGSQPCEGCMLPSTTHPRACVRPPGLEPESYAWKAQILPLYYGRTRSCTSLFGRRGKIHAQKSTCTIAYPRPNGATAARWIPDPKAGGSNPSSVTHPPGGSSVGRAVDCKARRAAIHWSAVQICLPGVPFSFLFFFTPPAARTSAPRAAGAPVIRSYHGEDTGSHQNSEVKRR